MTLLSRSPLLAAALVAPALALTACGQAERPAPQPARAAFETRPTLDSQLRRVVAAGAPGVMALVNDGHGVRLQARGVLGKGSRHALRPTDRFRAGSMTKSFVATVALQLVGEGKLSLTDTVERRLPGILPYGDRVTLRQLLNLTSGVPDNQDAVDAAWAKDLTHSWSPRELVALVADRQPDFAPGTGWSYSNTNYMLAGLMIERVTGHRLGQELQRRIFTPLHLRDTSFPVNATVIPGRHPSGYAFVDGKLIDVTELNPSGTWAAGNMVSTVSDIARFWRALLGGKLLAPEQLKAMKTTVPSWKGTPTATASGSRRSPATAGRCGTTAATSRATATSSRTARTGRGRRSSWSP